MCPQQTKRLPSFSTQPNSRPRLDDTITIESPAFAESIKEGDIQLVKKAGDSVAADEVIAKVETDKTTMDIIAPSAGVITEWLVEDGSTIGPNQAVVKFSVGGAASAPVAAPSPAPEAPKPAPEPVKAATRDGKSWFNHDLINPFVID